MASKIPPDTRPTSRPPATGADHEVAPPVAGLAALGAAGVALSAAAAWIAATGAGPAPHGFSAVVHALVIAAPIAAGLYAVYVNPRGRFGWLLILAGVLWSPTMLAESPDSVLYSIGRVWVWFAELLLVYLVLAFPSGRFASRADRLLFRAGVVAVGVYLLLALLGDFPRRAPGPAAEPTARRTRSCCRAPSPASWTPCFCRSPKCSAWLCSWASRCVSSAAWRAAAA